MSLEHSPSRDASDKTSLKDDLLFGAQAIADYIGVDLRRAFYLLEKRYIPGVKVGATWTSTKSRLWRHFNEKPEQ
jgi:hypothetical protein